MSSSDHTSTRMSTEFCMTTTNDTLSRTMKVTKSFSFLAPQEQQPCVQVEPSPKVQLDIDNFFLKKLNQPKLDSGKTFIISSVEFIHVDHHKDNTKYVCYYLPWQKLVANNMVGDGLEHIGRLLVMPNAPAYARLYISPINNMFLFLFFITHSTLVRLHNFLVIM